MDAATIEPGRPDGATLSVLITLRNQHGAVAPLYDRLTAVLAGLDVRYQLVVVDDGSEDGTGEALERLARHDGAVTAVLLNRKAGEEAALSAALARSEGQAVIMGAGPRELPELIPRMLAAWRAGAEVVKMRRSAPRPASALARLASSCRCRLPHPFPGTAADIGDFQLLSRRAVEALTLVVDRRRYMTRLFDWMGLQTVAIEYDSRPGA